MADNSILIRLDGLKLKYEEIGQKLTDPEVIADVKQFIQLNKEYKELEPIIFTSDRYRTAIANLAEAKDTLLNDKDEEMREMAREMAAELEPEIVRLEEEIKLLLIPKDPQDSKNAIVEIRGGTGGDEAAIFAGDLPILIHAPGTPAAAATLLDGYPMCQKGEAGKALSIAMFASFCGGIIGALCMTFLSPLIADVAMEFTS
ncbi:MAG: PCRF domain-containing protein, partial [Alistipes sp.]|nr:PCRF domain-containing protein [Alistipes sp.]